MRTPIPTERTFRFKQIEIEGEDPTIKRMDEDDPFDPDTCFSVSFRQGTRGDDTVRVSYLNQRKYITDPNTGEYMQLDEFNPDLLAKTEVGLTIVGTTMQYPLRKTKPKDGEDPLVWKDLEFESRGSVVRVKLPQAFDAWWNSIVYTQWANEIYRACLEVNPKWGGSKSLE